MMTKPTQAQIAAARQIATQILLCENTAIVPASRHYLIERFTQEIAALTAAAEVEKQNNPLWQNIDDTIQVAKNATIERCAQVADKAAQKALEEYQRCIDSKDGAADYYLWCHDEAIEIAAAIRALKEKP